LYYTFDIQISIAQV